MIRYGKNVRLTSNEQSALALLTQTDAKANEQPRSKLRGINGNT